MKSDLNDFQMQRAEADQALKSLLTSIIKEKTNFENLLENINTTLDFNLFLEFKTNFKNVGDSNINKMLEIIKKYKLYQLVKSRINFQNLDNANNLIKEYVIKLSTVALTREKELIIGSNNYAWLGNSLSIFLTDANLLNDHVTIDSEYPIMVKSVGIGLSACSKMKVKLLRLYIYEGKDNLVAQYDLNYSQNSKNRLTTHFDLSNEVLLESGVTYTFRYEVQGFYIYIIHQSHSVKHGNYTIRTNGASMTFYLNLTNIC